MKRSLLCALAVLAVSALPSTGRAAGLFEEGSLLGAGVMLSESPYKGVDDEVSFVPVMILEEKRFFVEGTSFGYYFNDSSSPLRWALLGSLRLQGYDADDGSDLDGMRDRDRAFDGGLKVSWKNSVADLSLAAVADLSGTHEGQEVRLSASREFFKGGIKPRVGVSWQSEDLAGYYYGVNADEARPGRTAYAPGDDIEYSAGVRVGVPLGKRWALFADVGCTFLGGEAKDSPIVADDKLMRYMAGAAYRF